MSTPLSGSPGVVYYFNVQITCTNTGQNIFVPHTVTIVSCTGGTTSLNSPDGLQDLEVYPNPNHGEFTLKFSKNPSGNFIIADFTGRVLLTIPVVTDEVKISVASLPGGMYLGQFQESTITRRIEILKE